MNQPTDANIFLTQCIYRSRQNNRRLEQKLADAHFEIEKLTLRAEHAEEELLLMHTAYDKIRDMYIDDSRIANFHKTSFIDFFMNKIGFWVAKSCVTSEEYYKTTCAKGRV